MQFLENVSRKSGKSKINHSKKPIYPELFYEPIIKKALRKIIENKRRVNQSENEVAEDQSEDDDI